MGQVSRVITHGGDQGNAQGKHTRKYDTDGGIFAHFSGANQAADSQRSNHSRHQRPPEERLTRPAPDQISHRDPRQNRMSQGIAKECHAAQHHIRPYDGTNNPHQHSRQHTPLHKSITQGSNEKIQHRAHRLSSSQQASPIAMVSPSN